MRCPNCGSSGKYPGEACFSCGKGGATRVADATELHRRGGGEPRHYKTFDVTPRRRGANKRNGT